MAGRPGPQGRHKRRRGSPASCVSAAVRWAQALGTGGLRIGPTACSTQAVRVTSHPGHLVSALRRPVFLSWCQEAGDVCGDRCPIWQGEQIPGKRREGLHAQCPRGPSKGWGGSSPALLPPGSLTGLQRNPAGLLNTKRSYQNPQGRTPTLSFHPQLSPGCTSVVASIPPH